MPCPNCGSINPEANKFCGACGTELVAVCSSCGTSNPPTSKFCGECGSALAPGENPTRTATPVRAEQRLVSVLFADLVGFTPFSESRDSEEVRDMLTTYFDRSRAVIGRFGGTVDKFIGDAVMAVWGATGAQEDDAERSVRASLELVDMVAVLGDEIGVPELALRAGVTTGETSVGPGGNEKGLVVGDLVNTASRLQSIAEPGAVFVGEATRNLTAASIQYEPRGEQTVKGKDAPVTAFHALRVVGERGGARIGEELEAPFTGREVELRMLKDQLHAAAAEGSARLVSVIGDAGIGKSRLSWELEKYLDGLADDVYWHRGRSPSYGDGLAMWALGEMVRSRAGITETEDPSRARLKLRTAVAEYVESEDDRTWLEPRLAALIGLEEAPGGDREELYAALRSFFQHISTRGVTALVFEDMHWADPGLLDFVAELVERSPRHPILVVTLARPELLETHPGWGAGRANFLSIHLGPLGDDSMRTLVSGMVPGIAEQAVDAIVARAAGIPLYAVEFVRMLVGSGELTLDEGVYRLTDDVGDLALPDSLQAVIGARIDRMSPEDRELVQDAAVLGHSFTVEGLAVVRQSDVESLATDLDRLVRQHVLEIEDDPRSPERGQYVFVQSAIREVAYGRLSKTDRHVRHLRVAEYFEGLSDSTGLVGAVASHYLAAADNAPAEEAAGLLERGRAALTEAAARAAALQSHAAALSLLDQALELAPPPEEHAALLEAAARSAAWGSEVDRAIELADRAAGEHATLGDRQAELRARRLQAFALNSNFRADEGVALLRPIYDSIDDPTTAEELELSLEMGRAHMLDQDFEPAVQVLERVLGRAEQQLEPDAIIDGLITKATALGGVGRLLEAVAILSGAVELADEHELQDKAIRAFNNLYVVRSYDAPGAALEAADELLGRVRRLGAPAWLNRATGDMAHASVAHGDLDRALALAEELQSLAVSDLERGTAAHLLALIRSLRGEPGALEELHGLAGQWDGATDTQLRGYVASMKAGASMISGDFEGMYEWSLLDRSPTGFVLLMEAAIALWDRDLIRDAVEFIEEHGLEGRLSRAARRLRDAAIAVQDGSEGAAIAMSDAVDEWCRHVDPLGKAFMRVVFCKAMPDDDGARRAGVTGLQWLHDHGMTALVELAVDWVPEDVEQAASA